MQYKNLKFNCCWAHRPLPVDCLFLTSSTVRRLVGMPLRSAQRGQAQSPSVSSSHSTPRHSRWKLRGQLSHSARGLPSGWCICSSTTCCGPTTTWKRGGGGRPPVNSFVSCLSLGTCTLGWCICTCALQGGEERRGVGRSGATKVGRVNKGEGGWGLGGRGSRRHVSPGGVLLRRWDCN